MSEWGNQAILQPPFADDAKMIEYTRNLLERSLTAKGCSTVTFSERVYAEEHTLPNGIVLPAGTLEINVIGASDD